jgi:hypothetical protein
MNEQAQALLATRTVAVRLPSGESEYWLTDRVFSEGDTYTRNVTCGRYLTFCCQAGTATTISSSG